METILKNVHVFVYPRYDVFNLPLLPLLVRDWCVT